MLRRLVLGFTMVAVFIFTLGWIGCSENDKTLTTNITGNGTGDEFVNYFPLDEGQTSLYEVTYSDGSTEDIDAGGLISFGAGVTLVT